MAGTRTHPRRAGDGGGVTPRVGGGAAARHAERPTNVPPDDRAPAAANATHPPRPRVRVAAACQLNVARSTSARYFFAIPTQVSADSFTQNNSSSTERKTSGAFRTKVQAGFRGIAADPRGARRAAARAHAPAAAAAAAVAPAGEHAALTAVDSRRVGGGRPPP